MRIKLSFLLIATLLTSASVMNFSCKKADAKDTTPPTLTIDSPTAGEDIALTILGFPVSVTATDETGLSKIVVDITSASGSLSSTDEADLNQKSYTYSFNKQEPILAPQAFTLKATATDQSGNTVTKSVNFSLH